MNSPLPDRQTNYTTREVAGRPLSGAESPSPGFTADPEGQVPGALEGALRDALSSTDRFAVVIIDLDTGLSKTAFTM